MGRNVGGGRNGGEDVFRVRSFSEDFSSLVRSEERLVACLAFVRHVGMRVAARWYGEMIKQMNAQLRSSIPGCARASSHANMLTSAPILLSYRMYLPGT